MEDLVRIQEEDFCVEDLLNRVKSSSGEIGGLVTFSGTARCISRGKKIRSLDFEHYPGMAKERLCEIRQRALRTFNVIEMAIVHRVGRIEIGEDIVVIIAAARHRNDAFMACEWAITELKRSVPIWKKETTEDGEVWVEEHP